MGVLFLIGALVELYFNWKIGLSGLILSLLLIRMTVWLGKEFRFKTVGEVARFAATESYALVRSDSDTVNRCEIERTIRELFMYSLDLEPAACAFERDSPLV